MAALLDHGVIPPEDYLDTIFHPSDSDLCIPLSYRSDEGNHCHSANALKVYRRDDQLVYRVVKYHIKDDPTRYQYYSSRLDIKRKGRYRYKFKGEVGSLKFSLSFKASNQGRIEVVWKRSGYDADRLHVCADHVRVLLGHGQIQ